MGVSRSPEQLAAKFAYAATAIGDNKVAIERTAFAVKQVFQASLAMSGVTGSTRISRAVKVRYSVKGKQNATALVRYTGPAHLLNNPTKPHFITPKGVRGSRRSRQERATLARTSRPEFKGFGSFTDKKGARALTIGSGGEPRAYAHHPGTSGLGFYQRAVPIAARVAPQVYRQAGFREPLRRIF